MAGLMAMLERERLADNTILIFMTDSGTVGGLNNGRGYDGGMRGTKNSAYEGGHRVPFILRWPVEADRGLKAGSCGKVFRYKQARLLIGDADATKAIPPGANEVTFKVLLKKGVTKRAPVCIEPELTATPYYAYVTHRSEPGWQTPQMNKKKTKVIELVRVPASATKPAGGAHET